MRILLVALADSIHVARWIRQFEDQGWDIHLFPSIDTGTVHPEIKNVTVYHSVYHTDSNMDAQNRTLTRHGIHIRTPNYFSRSNRILAALARGLRFYLQKRDPQYRVKQLQRVIQKLQPDIVHSMEFQAAGYLTLMAKTSFQGKFPTWIISNYGSDLYLFGRLREHKDRIKALLTSCDYYTSECHRDARLARSMGLKGKILDIIPNGGGFDLQYCQHLRQPGPTSQRRLILIKGYQHWSGRALVALHALELCAEIIRGYHIAVHLPSSTDVAIQAEIVSQKIGIPIHLISPRSHEEILRLHGHARVHLGLGISDAASTSMLEAMAMGAFPIQSYTACADEWFHDGEGGLLVPPEDPATIAQALRRAICDDGLVDRAAELNAKVIAERLDYCKIRERAIDLYKKAVALER